MTVIIQVDGHKASLKTKENKTDSWYVWECSDAPTRKLLNETLRDRSKLISKRFAVPDRKGYDPDPVGTYIQQLVFTLKLDMHSVEIVTIDIPEDPPLPPGYAY